MAFAVPDITLMNGLGG